MVILLEHEQLTVTTLLKKKILPPSTAINCDSIEGRPVGTTPACWPAQCCKDLVQDQRLLRVHAHHVHITSG